MIDWITAIIDFDHSEEAIFDGYIFSTNGNDEPVWQTKKAVSAEGSWSNKVRVKSHGKSGYRDFSGNVRYRQIYIDGNPSKFLQGHNVFGSNNLLQLNKLFFFKIFKEIGLEPNVFEINKIVQGNYLLNRVDCTDYLNFKNNQEVDLILNRLVETGTYVNRGNATSAKGTAYFGQKSTWFAIKLYNKFKELNKHQIPYKVNNREKIKNWSENKLRCELVLRSRELQKIDKRIAKNWSENTVIEMLNTYVNNNKINITKTADFTDNEIIDMPKKLRGTFALWKAGIDTSSVMSRANWYKHRRDLLSYGIDISTKPPKSNVIALKRVIEIDFFFSNSRPNFG